MGCGLSEIQNHEPEGVTVTGRGGNGNMSPASQPALVSATSSGLATFYALGFYNLLFH